VRIYKKRGRTYIADAFINKGLKTGKPHVMKRPPNVGRDPAYIQYGPSIVRIANQNLPRILQRTEPVFQKRLEHEINRALSKL